MTYAAPLADLRFAMDEVAGLAGVGHLPGCEEVTGDVVDAILGEAGRFAETELAPLNAAGDRNPCRLVDGEVRLPDGFAAAYRRFVAGGWPALAGPADAGGQALPHLVATACGEIWTAANMALAVCPMLTRTAAEFVDRHGDARLRRLILPKLVSGAWTGTMILTEPQAGSDLALLRTQAVPVNGGGDAGYRLKGQKIFITYGEHDLTENIVHIVLARTPDAPPGLRGLSVFVVPKRLLDGDGRPAGRNDVRCLSLERKLGLHASPTAVMAFGEGDGALGWMVGQPNRGLEYMFTMMNTARLGVGLQGVGIADRAYQLARAYARERIQGRRLGGTDPGPVPIIDHPDVQRMLLGMRVTSEAARALALFVAARLDFAERHPDPAVRAEHLALATLLTPVVKAWSTDIGIEVASTAIQVFGGYGYIEDSGAPQMLRDARVAAIYEGTNGIQAIDLAFRKVAQDDGRVADALIQRMQATAAALAGRADPLLAGIGARLAAAVGDFAQATAWVIATHGRDPRRLAAGATPYLELAGITAGGWLMAKAAASAAARHAEGRGDPRFLAGKVTAARFFADTILTRSPALVVRVEAAGETLADLDWERDI
jgi:alkylation response protein AidB-like acyl-CoA dehydrogenase